MLKLHELKISESVQQTKKNWPKLASLRHEKRCELILEIANSISGNIPIILEANLQDLEVAKKDNLSTALIDRLTLTEARLKAMASGLQKIAKLSDPLSESIEWTHSQGMMMSKVRVPIGVILVVYEARPNVTTDTVGLAIKTGNSAILKGSRQTKFTNQKLADIILKVLGENGLANVISFFPELNSEQAIELVSHKDLDLVIPRGGEGLKAFVKEHSKAPILGAGGGICHVYVSESADLEIAKDIIFNAKTQRPGTCNSLETVLIHEKLLNKQNIQTLFTSLLEAGVVIKADEKVKVFNDNFEPALAEDWDTEYLDLILSVKSVSSTEEAIEHINKHSTNHSDTIVTQNEEDAELFCKEVDSGCVYINVSTRFTDGEEFGFGAEIGISTQKLHARGPIGPKELTTYKYIIKGTGQIRG